MERDTISTIKVNVVVIEMFTDKKIVIGRKQTLRALSRDEAQTVIWQRMLICM